MLEVARACNNCVQGSGLDSDYTEFRQSERVLVIGSAPRPRNSLTLVLHISEICPFKAEATNV